MLTSCWVGVHRVQELFHPRTGKVMCLESISLSDPPITCLYIRNSATLSAAWARDLSLSPSLSRPGVELLCSPALSFDTPLTFAMGFEGLSPSFSSFICVCRRLASTTKREVRRSISEASCIRCKRVKFVCMELNGTRIFCLSLLVVEYVDTEDVLKNALVQRGVQFI